MFQITLQVRDYECDIQGIVNNAVYQNYFEHARHLYLKSKGISFAEITKSGIHLIIYRAEIDYLFSLTHDDIFEVSVEFERISRLKYQFTQKILKDTKVYTIGNFYVTGIDNNKKPVNLDKTEFKDLLK